MAAASSAVGAAATAYVLRSLNPKLFFSPQPLREDERQPLLTRWYRIHAIRLTASAIALAAIHHARTLRLRNSNAQDGAGRRQSRIQVPPR